MWLWPVASALSWPIPNASDLLDNPFSVLVGFGTLRRWPVGELVPNKHPDGLVAWPQGQLDDVALAFDDQYGGCMQLDLVPQLTAVTNWVRSSLPCSGDKKSTDRPRQEPAWFSVGRKEAPGCQHPTWEQFASPLANSLPNTMEGDKSRSATHHPQRRSTGSLEKGPPVPSRNISKQSLSAHVFKWVHEWCVTHGSTSSHAASTSTHTDGTAPQVQKHRLEEVLGF